MQVRISSAPAMWGVESAHDPANPTWPSVLAAMADVGFEGTELGPLGYLPERADVLREALAARSLELSAAFVMEPFHDATRRADILDVARRTCALVRDTGGLQLVLIEALAPVRLGAAGRSEEAPRLEEPRWRDMVVTIDEVAAAARDHGLQATFHPHAGTYVEFADEIERLMVDMSDRVGLCLDTGHAAYAAIDPVDLLRAYGDRVHHVHLKDVRADVLARCTASGLSFTQAVTAGVFCPLGEGMVDFVAVREGLAEVGYEGWATIEQDRVSDHGDPRADAEASLEHVSP
jgi:inosose dehydratase